MSSDLFDQVFTEEINDNFPSNQEWRDFINRCLDFIETKEQLDRYKSRLNSRKTERDEALAEIYAAYFLEKELGCEITKWEVKTVKGKDVEFVIKNKDGKEIYCEVKSPGWEGELDRSDGKKKKEANERAKNYKYINAEVKSIAPWERIRFSIKKAYGKFDEKKFNLLIIVDDLFASPLDIPSAIDIALLEEHGCYNNEKGYFQTDQYKNLGGCCFLRAWLEVELSEVVFQYQFRKNEEAIKPFDLV